nr:graves disease carrier protein [Meriones unguiculatus]
MSPGKRQVEVHDEGAGRCPGASTDPEAEAPVAACTKWCRRGVRGYSRPGQPPEQRCLPRTDLTECSRGSALAGPCTAEREAKRELDSPKPEPDSSRPFLLPSTSPFPNSPPHSLPFGLAAALRHHSAPGRAVGIIWPRPRGGPAPVSRLQPWCCPVFCKLAAEARDVAQVPMAVAAAALAAADPAPAVPQAAGSGGPASRRDFYWLRSFLAGGIAGCCAKTTVAPLDRVKVLLQAHNHHYKHLGVLSTLRAVPKKEGYLGLYKGNGAMMIRIFPYGAIQFMAFEHYKTFITTKLGVSGHVHRLMAGSMAGMTAVICTYPLDVVRVRLAFQVKGEHTYSGIIHAFKTIYAKVKGVDQ